MQSLTLESATEKTPGLVGRLAPRLHAKAFTGGLIVLTFIVVGILGPALAPYDPNKQELTAMTKPPQGVGSVHVLGTDNLGRDVLSRVIYGARVSLLVAFAVVFISGFVGISLGAISGYFGGKTDFLIQKLVEVVWAFPPLLLGITIMAFLGQGLFNLILALVVQRWIPYCRVVRGQALSLRTREFVVASRCLGARNAQIILRHILPNVIQTSLVIGTFAMASAIIAEASLSFLGVGVPPEIPTWGTMLADARIYISTAWWLPLFPGLCIFVTVLGINLLGDALRDLLDPRLKRADLPASFFDSPTDSCRLMKMRRTKIVCTIGPASASEKVLRQLIQTGMNVARLNFSHGDYAFHRRIIRTIRRLERKLERPVAILQDLPGPKIRIGAMEGNHVRLRSRQPLVLTTREMVGNEEMIFVNYKGLTKSVKKGDPILLGDGEIELEVVKVGKQTVTCRVVVGGILGSHKGIHFPQSSLNIRALTTRDKKDLAFGIEHKVDMIALSFVRNSDDIVYARREMKNRGASIPIIAKIEKHEALDHIDGILEEVDGIMVARGDLGLEIAPEKIPAMQKMMIRKANVLGKPVITATQMLRSMVQNPRPTRAEVADIANAVLDGTDALMLSEESAAGDYPVQAVRTMAEVAEETERILEPRYQFAGRKKSIPEAISFAAISLARDLQVAAFLIPTSSGSTARMIARYRPQHPIIAFTPERPTLKTLCLVWGVYPVGVPAFHSTDAMLQDAQKKALKLGFVKRGDLVAITAGLPLQQAGTTNMITVKPIE